MRLIATFIFLIVALFAFSQKQNQRYEVANIANCLSKVYQIKSVYIKCMNDDLVFSSADFLAIYNRDVAVLDDVNDK
jgi:hypothetical protein